MKCITIKNAVLIFCYLMNTDGTVKQSELEKFDEIGLNFDNDNFLNYREDVLEECRDQILSVFDNEDRYDVISEGVDKALYANVNNDEDVIASRLLVWNLLTVAYIDENYHNDERRLIKHIARVCDIPKQVFSEMELLMRTAVEVIKERDWLSRSERPYCEIVPIMTELEKRLENLSKAAKNLISDEINELSSVEELKMAPTLSETIAETTAPVTSEIKKAVVPIAEKTGAAVSGLFGGIGKIFGGNNKQSSIEDNNTIEE